MGMNQNNTYQFRKASLFADMNSGKHDGGGRFEQENTISESFISDNLRFSRISMYENKNNHSSDCNRKGTEKSQGEFRSFQIGIDGKSKRIKLEPFVSKTRNRTTPDQLLALENVCKTTMRPNKEMRIKLANKLNMNQRQVQIWFQNKRAKAKKQSRNAKEQDTLGTHKDVQASQHHQEIASSQRLPHSGMYFAEGELLHSNEPNPKNPSSMRSSSGGQYSIYSAPSSYPRHYCSLGDFHPREHGFNMYESDRARMHHGISSYYTDTFPEMSSGDLRQYHQNEDWDYLINKNVPGISRMYCNYPKGHYQNYNNNKQF